MASLAWLRTTFSSNARIRAVKIGVFSFAESMSLWNECTCSPHTAISHIGRRNSWFRQLFSRGPVRLQSRASSSGKPDARDTVKWLTKPWPMIDRPRATLQRCCSAGARRSFSFLSAPRCRGFVTSCSQPAQVRCCRRPREWEFCNMCAPPFSACLLALGRRNRKPMSCRTWRSTVGGLFVFLPSAH